jgi:mono/diheme cytochrome c family protein
MHTSRLIATAIAIGALSLGVLTACGGGDNPAGTIGGEVTIGTGTNPTSTPVETGGEAATTAAETTGGETTAAAAEGDAAAGEAVFASAGCTGCHTLAAAGSNGNVGPNLDEVKPDYATVMQFVTNGQGAMPSFSGQLSEDDIKNVAAYVSQNAGK